MKTFLLIGISISILSFSCKSKNNSLGALLIDNNHDATIIVEQEVTKNKKYRKTYFYEPSNQTIIKSFNIEIDDTIKNLSSDFKNYIHFLKDKKIVTDNMDVVAIYDSLSQKYVSAYINNSTIELIFSKQRDGLEFINIQTDSCKYELQVKNESNGNSSLYHPIIDTLQTRCYK